MSTVEKIADLKYCYQVLDCIKDLEKTVCKREGLIVKFHQKVEQDGKTYALLGAWIIPIVSLFGLVWRSFSHIGAIELREIIGRTIIVVLISLFSYILVYFGVKATWRKGMMKKRKRISYLKWDKKLENEKILINRRFEEILEKEALKNHRIDLNYYSGYDFQRIIDYLETDKAGFLSEAVYLLDRSQEENFPKKRSILEDVKEQMGKDFLLESVKK